MPGVVETTDTFATNQVITSTAMNNIIDQTLFTSDAIASGNTTLALVAGKLKVGTITSNEMGTNAVTANAIASNAVTTAKILDANVTTAKILDANVTTAKILDANVTTAKIADAAITAPKLNGAQTGAAPIYGIRAWVNFDGTTADDIGGTYSRTLTTVTVTTSVDHGLIVGHKVFLDFTSGGAADGAFVVTGVTSNTVFTVTHGTSGTILTGNVTLSRRLIRASGNVSSVSLLATGKYAVNFTTALPNANYARSGFANFTDGDTKGFVGGTDETATTEQSCDINASSTATGSEGNFTVVNAMFVG
jgi:hypothetical protein